MSNLNLSLTLVDLKLVSPKSDSVEQAHKSFIHRDSGGLALIKVCGGKLYNYKNVITEIQQVQAGEFRKFHVGYNDTRNIM